MIEGSTNSTETGKTTTHRSTDTALLVCWLLRNAIYFCEDFHNRSYVKTRYSGMLSTQSVWLCVRFRYVCAWACLWLCRAGWIDLYFVKNRSCDPAVYLQIAMTTTAVFFWRGIENGQSNIDDSKNVRLTGKKRENGKRLKRTIVTPPSQFFSHSAMSNRLSWLLFGVCKLSCDRTHTLSGQKQLAYSN